MGGMEWQIIARNATYIAQNAAMVQRQTDTPANEVLCCRQQEMTHPVSVNQRGQEHQITENWTVVMIRFYITTHFWIHVNVYCLDRCPHMERVNYVIDL